MDLNRPPLEMGSTLPPPAEVCRAEVARLLAFRDFAAAPQLRNFLEYIVEETLSERGDQLKERNIAVHALLRDSDFDPRLDCVVRVMAGKLRKALESYYRGPEGAAAEVWIEVPRGAYRPVFRSIEPVHREAHRSRVSSRAIGEVAIERPVLAVLPLLALTVGRDESALAEALACEACVQLRQLRWLELLDYLVTRRWRSDPADIASDDMHCDYTVGGTCRRQAGQFRVTVQLTNVGDGHLLWAEQFDLLAVVDDFAAEDLIVARICTAVSQSLRPAAQIDKATQIDQLMQRAAGPMRRGAKGDRAAPMIVKVLPKEADRLPAAARRR